MKRAALYDPYLDTLGGGEKHILSILRVLEDEGYEINLFWDKNLQNQIENRFRLQFSRKLKFLPNIFRNSSFHLQKLMVLKDFDIFFYVTDGSYFFSSAGKNFVFCMVPNKNLYNLSLFNKLKLSNFRYITNSVYTQSWLNKWGINPQVIYPYLNQEFTDMRVDNLKKEKVILSVGRFYSHLHSKKQSILTKLFNKLKQSNPLFKNFKLIMAGGLNEEDKPYFNKLQLSINKSPDISLKTNLPYHELLNLYKKSLFYIHMTGYNVDQNKSPERVEHLGIAPLEAMASGCLTFCHDAGGPREIITDRENGFLFKTQEELIKKMLSVLSNPELQTRIKKRAKRFVQDNFNYEIFKKKVKEVIL